MENNKVNLYDLPVDIIVKIVNDDETMTNLLQVCVSLRIKIREINYDSPVRFTLANRKTGVYSESKRFETLRGFFSRVFQPDCRFDLKIRKCGNGPIVGEQIDFSFDSIHIENFNTPTVQNFELAARNVVITKSSFCPITFSRNVLTTLLNCIDCSFNEQTRFRNLSLKTYVEEASVFFPNMLNHPLMIFYGCKFENVSFGCSVEFADVTIRYCNFDDASFSSMFNNQQLSALNIESSEIPRVLPKMKMNNLNVDSYIDSQNNFVRVKNVDISNVEFFKNDKEMLLSLKKFIKLTHDEKKLERLAKLERLME